MLTDPLRSSVLLHLHGGVDYSSHNHVVTAESVVSTRIISPHDTVKSVFNGSSSRLNINRNSVFNVGAADFVIEALINLTSYHAGQRPIFSTGVNSAPYYGLRFRVAADGKLQLGVSTDGGGSLTYAASASAVPLNTPVHVAGYRIGGAIFAAIAGVSGSPAAVSGSVHYRTSDPVAIGYDYSYLNTWFSGWVADARWTVAQRYSGGFTPPGALLAPQYPDYRTKYPLAGNATKLRSNPADPINPADAVVIRDWVTHELAAVATPNSSGDWTADVPPGTYDVTWVEDGCAAICDGPYTVVAA